MFVHIKNSLNILKTPDNGHPRVTTIEIGQYLL